VRFRLLGDPGVGGGSPALCPGLSTTLSTLARDALEHARSARGLEERPAVSFGGGDEGADTAQMTRYHAPLPRATAA